MNILWKVENVIINFYIRKWGRNIKQTALNIEHGPHVKRIVSRIMGELTVRWGRNEKRDDNQPSCIFLLLCRDGKVKPVCPTTIREEARDHYGGPVCVCVCFQGYLKSKRLHHLFIYWFHLPPPVVLFLLLYCIQNKSRQNVLHSICRVLTLTCICSSFMYHAEQERSQSGHCGSNSRDTLNRMETRDIWSTTSDYTTQTLSTSTVLSMCSWIAPCSAYILYLPFWGSLLFSTKVVLLVLGAFRILLRLLPTLCSPSSMNIYMTVSGPVCILLCIPVVSGEGYKKNSWSPAQTTRQK